MAERLIYKKKWKRECEKCCNLEKQLEEVTKKASEAQSRMNSIAKILCLGSLDCKNEETRNNALNIVSQILLDSSPKRKRRCHGNSPTKENVLIPASLDLDTENFNKKYVDFGGDGDIIPETMTHTPLKPIITNVVSVKTPPNKRAIHNEQTPPRFSTSINLPVEESSHRIASVRKNLSADCINVNQHEHYSDIIEFSPPTSKKKGLSFNIDMKTVVSSRNACDTTLDASLLEYVKDSRTELDKIWFDDEQRDDYTIVQQKDSVCPVKEDKKLVVPENQIVEETPTREENRKLVNRKRADFWLLKEKRELNGKSKTLDGKKLKQTKLELGIKTKSVDISKLAGFEDGIQQLSQRFDNNKDDDIIPASPGSQTSEVAPMAGNVINEINSLEPISFQPVASSTQRSAVNIKDLVTVRSTSSSKSPDYVYKRDAVKKKCERARLPGWDCDECRKYYETMSLSPSKVKSRMNACSRHRDKFRPKLNETPPGFWNPLFPDTQECREKGMYVSIHYPADRDK